MSATPARAPLVVAGALALGAIAFHFQTVVAASVDVPFLDDWDALLGFQIYWSRADSLAARVRLLFDPHNEHLLAIPRALVLGVYQLSGRVDFTWLNLIGNAFGVAFLAALWSNFWRNRPTHERALAFVPAVLIVLQPQAWTAIGSPTVSLSNLGVLAFAAGCYAALASGGGARLGVAAGCAAAAVFCSANGILVAPFGCAILWLRGERGAAGVWGAAAALGAATYLIAAPSDYAASDPLAALRQPGQLVAYTLNFIGCAPGFARPLPSLLAGIALCIGFGALAFAGLPRRNAFVFTLALFVLASIVANAVVRAHQGATAPLFQPRYRLYSAALLALQLLAWAEVLRERWNRALPVATLAAALVFWGASVVGGSAAAREHAESLEAGLAQWWQTGVGGLRHPDPRKAEFFLHAALDANLLRLPDSWGERFGEVPQRAQHPATRRAARVTLDTASQRQGWLTVLGRTRLDGRAEAHAVEIMLAHDGSEYVAPALSVMRQEPKHARRERGHGPAAAGFHAYIDTRAMPRGSYRLGVVIQQGERRHFAWTDTTLQIGDDR